MKQQQMLLASKNQVYVVLIDVAKAFDRSAKIKIGTETSKDIQIQSGVPQGSVLSPTLYT